MKIPPSDECLKCVNMFGSTWITFHQRAIQNQVKIYDILKADGVASVVFDAFFTAVYIHET